MRAEVAWRDYLKSKDELDSTTAMDYVNEVRASHELDPLAVPLPNGTEVSTRVDRVLPDLRRAFTWLKPTETHALAAMLARLTGAAVTELDTVLEADPLLAERAASVERELVASLRRDGLTAWVAS
mgnify:CR=1 FL=1